MKTPILIIPVGVQGPLYLIWSLYTHKPTRNSIQNKVLLIEGQKDENEKGKNKSGSNDVSLSLSVGDGSTVTGNTAYYNQNNGISFGSGGNSLVDQNTAYQNNQSGGSYSNMGPCPSCTLGLNHAP